MLSAKLVHLIEQHSEELADGLVRKLQSSPQTQSLQRIPSSELQVRMQETLGQFNGWLLSSADADVHRRYVELGRHHAANNVALTDLCWATVFIKEYLWEFVGREVFPRGAVEIFAELELLRLLDLFFDRVLCYMAEGYQQAENEMSTAASINWQARGKYMDSQRRHAVEQDRTPSW
jgi:hypothetical protein